MAFSASLRTEVLTIFADNQDSHWQSANEVSGEAYKLAFSSQSVKVPFCSRQSGKKGASAHVARDTRIIHFQVIAHPGLPNGNLLECKTYLKMELMDCWWVVKAL
jgi:hypothetical protein